MDNNSYEQFIIMQAAIETKNQEMKSNKKDFDDKTMKVTEDLKAMIDPDITSTMDQINT